MGPRGSVGTDCAVFLLNLGLLDAPTNDTSTCQTNLVSLTEPQRIAKFGCSFVQGSFPSSNIHQGQTARPNRDLGVLGYLVLVSRTYYDVYRDAWAARSPGTTSDLSARQWPVD